MTTTSTYAFNPAASDLSLAAFERIGIRGPEITAQHMASAVRESNLVQVELSNRLPNLFAKETYSFGLSSGTATYELPSRLLAFQAAWLSTDYGSGTATDRLIYPYSAYEYAAIADKTQEGPPTSYYLNTVVPPQITFWPTPDDSATYTFRCYMLRQFQDASLKSGYTVDVAYRAIDTWVAKLAHRLARIYAVPLEAQRRQDAEEAWAVFATTDQEQVPIYIQAQISTYYG